jgi:light-harvesting complex 1 beta chain
LHDASRKPQSFSAGACAFGYEIGSGLAVPDHSLFWKQGDRPKPLQRFLDFSANYEPEDIMSEKDARTGSLNGLTQAEAKEFHNAFMGSTILYILVAIGAHILVWMWRPWFPAIGGYSELKDGIDLARQTASAIFG